MVGLVVISIIWTISVPEILAGKACKVLKTQKTAVNDEVCFSDCPHSCQPEDSCQASIGLIEQADALLSQNDFTGYLDLIGQVDAMRSGCSNNQVCCKQSDVKSDEEISK